MNINTSIKIFVSVLWLYGLCACTSTKQQYKVENYSLIKLRESLLDSVRTIPFDKLYVSSAIKLHVLRSDTPHLELRCNSAELAQRFEAHIEGEELRLNLRKAKPSISTLNKWNQNLQVYVAIPRLSAIHAQGACEVLLKSHFEGIGLDIALSGSSGLSLEQPVRYRKMLCQLSGASELMASHLLIDEITLFGEGSSDIEIKGKCSKLICGLEGASDADLDELETETASVELQGASSMELCVNKVLNYKTNGASNLRYRGKARLGVASSQGASGVFKR